MLTYSSLGIKCKERKKMIILRWEPGHQMIDRFVFNGKSKLVDYLMPHFVYIYIYI